MRGYLLILIGVLLAISTEAHAAKRALCIGNNSYKHTSSLKNPANDAADMAAALKRFGFDVTVKLDLDLRRIEGALQDFAGTINEGDTVIFFYAGHGVQVEGVNYLVPIDIDLAGQSRKDVKYKAIGADRVLETILRAQPGLSVLILDACRNDPFGSARGMGPGLAPMEAALGTMIVFSTGAGRTASDNPAARNGLFTQHLLATIDQKAPFPDVIRRVRELVYEASGKQQRPFLQEDVIGDFYLSGGKAMADSQAAATAAQPVPAPRSTESLLDKGMRLFRAGQFAQAAEAFDEARKAEPENAFAHNATGVALGALGDQARAVACFNAAISLKPTYASAFINRGLAYLEVPRYELAERDFSWAIGEDVDNPLAYLWRGRARLGMRKNEEAGEDLDRALELDQGSPDGWRLRGEARYRLRQYQDSLADLNQAILLAPDAPQNYAARAATYRALARHREAEADERRADQLRVKLPKGKAD